MYGCKKIQYLPTDGFKWLTQDDINKLDVKAFQENIIKGWISKVVLEYSEELQNLLNDYPLVTEKIEIKESVLSNYC